MLAFLKHKNPHEDAAARVYRTILAHVRQPAFYKNYNVPDTFTGRFDLLLLHIFMVMDAALYSGRDVKGFNQALFDATFADMDQTLRERGIGDMGVPKHMRRMMKGCNGRMLAYQEALAGPGDLQAVLRRNLYGTVAQADPAALARMESYVRRNAQILKETDFNDILNGTVVFQAP